VKNIDEIVAKNILLKMSQKGLSQRELAKLANIKATNLNQIIKAKRRAGRKTLTLLAGVLGGEWYDFQQDENAEKAKPRASKQADLFALVERALAIAQVPGLNRALALTIASGEIRYFDEYCDEAHLSHEDRDAAAQLSQALLIRLKAAK
jgi:transcriptional regulator with XRE-family HTH domain